VRAAQGSLSGSFEPCVLTERGKTCDPSKIVLAVIKELRKKGTEAFNDQCSIFDLRRLGEGLPVCYERFWRRRLKAKV
jgi:hypothetical protein